MSYGWMGRTADYKAALMNTLGANADWYGPFRDNARAWHRRAQEAVLFMNHAIVNPPIDRHKPAEAGEGRVRPHRTRRPMRGIYVSGAKVVATVLGPDPLQLPGARARQPSTEDPSTCR